MSVTCRFLRVMLAATTTQKVLTIGRRRQGAFKTRMPFGLAKIWLELRTQSLSHFPRGRYVKKLIFSLTHLLIYLLAACLGAVILSAIVFTAQCTLVHMRGLGIACRPSVCPSVCPSVRPSVTLVDCDHIGWKSWKLITRTTSLTPSLFVAKMRST